MSSFKCVSKGDLSIGFEDYLLHSMASLFLKRRFPIERPLSASGISWLLLIPRTIFTSSQLHLNAFPISILNYKTVSLLFNLIVVFWGIFTPIVISFIAWTVNSSPGIIQECDFNVPIPYYSVISSIFLISSIDLLILLFDSSSEIFLLS